MHMLCCLSLIIIVLALIGILKFFLKLVLWIIVAIILLGGLVLLGTLFSQYIP